MKTLLVHPATIGPISEFYATQGASGWKVEDDRSGTGYWLVTLDDGPPGNIQIQRQAQRDFRLHSLQSKE